MQHPFTLTIIVSLLSGSIYADGYYSTPTAGSDFSNGPKMYVGGSIGTVEQDDTCNDPFFKGSCDNQDTTWKAFGGMRVNPMFGGELAYHDLGQSTLSGTTGAGSTASLNNKATGIAASGVGYVPLMPNAEAFGKAGALFWERESNQTNASVSSNSKDDGTSPLIGAGVQYRLKSNVYVRGEWERFFDVGADSAYETDIDAYSIGMSYSTL